MSGIGAPINPHRYRALRDGQSMYEGRPCRHCGCTTRYVSNYACVPCQRWQGREGKRPDGPILPRPRLGDKPAHLPTAREQAIAAGAMKYIGEPCHRCGNAVRYTSNKNCQDCNNRRWVPAEARA